MRRKFNAFGIEVLRPRMHCFDTFKSRAIGEQGLQDCNIQPVAAAMRAEEPDDPRPREREVTNGIEHFVADELIRIAQSFRIKDTIRLYRNRIFERRAESEAGLPESFDISQEAEGAGPGEITTKRSRS